MAGRRRSLNRSSTGRLFEGQKKTIFIVNENGPLGQSIKDQAEEIVAGGQAEMTRIMKDHLSQEDLDDVLGSLNYVMKKDAQGNPYAVIGLRDRGEIENYIVKKNQGEQFFEKVIKEVMG